MGKMTRTAADASQRTQPARSREREALASAITERDKADAGEAALAQARARAREDMFKANRAVEDDERALARAREAARLFMVDAYVDGDALPDAPSAVADAEAALVKACRRQAEMKTVVEELAAHERAPCSGRTLVAFSTPKVGAFFRISSSMYEVVRWP
jgi:hypothetical protein